MLILGSGLFWIVQTRSYWVPAVLLNQFCYYVTLFCHTLFLLCYTLFRQDFACHSGWLCGAAILECGTDLLQSFLQVQLPQSTSLCCRLVKQDVLWHKQANSRNYCHGVHEA